MREDLLTPIILTPPAKLRDEAADRVAGWIGALPAESGPGGGKAWVRELRGYEDED
jgi:hypothetical protein